jgi:DNA-binding response OmpR family regulator
VDGTLDEGRALLRDSEPLDVAVLDLTLPDGDGTDLIAELRQRRPETPVAILSVGKDVDEATSKAGPMAQYTRAHPYPT